VEPDYLPDAEVLCFQPCLYPMKYLHPRSMYTLPRGGVQRGGTPSVGSIRCSRSVVVLVIVIIEHEVALP
jgi:hypothetical protein